MRTTIEELYYGNIMPYNRSVRAGSEYANLVGRLARKTAGAERGRAAWNADRSAEGDIRKDQGLLDGNEQHQRGHDLHAWIQAGAASYR